MNIIYPVIASQTSLPFYLTGIGRSEPEYRVAREKGLVSHQFLFTFSGTGMLSVGGNSYIQNVNSIFYLSPSVPHEYYPLSDDWNTCWLVFRGSHVSEIMSELGFREYEIRQECDLEQIKKLFERMIAAATNPLESEKCSTLIYKFILCARNLFFNVGNKGNNGVIVEPALEFITHNYMNDIVLDQLSELSGVSPQHFCRVFRTATGMRPVEYITKVRISQAKSLLLNTSKSIAEIGCEVGYPDQNYFGIVFKRHEGISPSEYRRMKSSLII